MDTGCWAAEASHRSAIELNNIGCLLLEKGAFEQARATFTDCLFLFQRLASLDETFLTEEYSFHLQDCLLQKASHRMAFPQAMVIRRDTTRQEDGADTTPQPPVPSSIKVVSMSDYNEFLELDQIMGVATRRGCSRSSCNNKEDVFLICPCRIEDVSVNRRGYNLGTVLFNLGSAYAALAHCCVNVDDLKAFATKVFLLADRSLHVSLHRNNCCNVDNDGITTGADNNHVVRSVAYTQLATLHGLLQTCGENATENELVDVNDVEKRISQLQNAIFLTEQLITGQDSLSVDRLPAASA